MERGVGGVGADPEVEGGGVEGPGVGGGVPVGEGGFAEGEVDGLSLVRSEGEALEAFEFADGAGGGAGLLVDVELGDFVGGA